MNITLLALLALVVWLVVVLDLRHRATRRAGRDPWAEVGPGGRDDRRPAPTARPSVSAVGVVPPVADPGDDRSDADPHVWVRAA